jgi:hypothetical protein
MVIRIYDVTCIIFCGDNAHSHFDTEVGPQDRDWYIRLRSPGKSLVADIGARGNDGTLEALARSNCVQTGHTGEDGDDSSPWLEVDRDPRRRRTPAADMAPATAMARVVQEDVVRFYRNLVSDEG